jgi:hypothetical protein
MGRGYCGHFTALTQVSWWESVWQGPDSHHPDPTATMLLYADRALSDEQIHVLTR